MLRRLKIFFLCCWFTTAAYAQDAAPVADTVSGALDVQEKSSMLDSLEIRDMDINDVLKLLASKSGLNIIAGKSITGRVTIFLQKVEVHDALTIILKANDLAYIEDRGVIQIVPASQYEQLTGHKFGVTTENTIISLQSLKAADAVTLLNQIKSQNGKIIADEQSNSIIIEDIPDQLKKLIDYIKMIDIPTETKVYELRFISGDTLVAKIQDMVSPKIGSVKFDGNSNKLFIKDTPKKLMEMDNIIKQLDVIQETRVFEISYAKAADLAKTITPMISKDVGTLQFDARSNTIIVTDIAPKMQEIEQVIKAMDKNDKEVLIEARIVQIELSDQYQMGINWEKILPNVGHNVVDFKNDFSLGSDVTQKSVTTIGTLNRESYNVVLQAIATFGNSRILSNPRIAVVNNQEARILVGSTTPYVTSTTTTTSSGPSTTAEAVNFIDTGIKLHVTPMIHDDGYVTIKIKPEVSNIPDSLSTSDGNKIPIVNTSEVETTIRVKDGVTIIMGGLIKDELKNNKNKIPVLGDLPFVGKAFRNESRSMAKTEIVIFLTPHIISGDVHVSPETFPYSTIKKNNTYSSPFPQEQSSDPVP